MLRNDDIERLERGGFAKGQAEVQVSVFEDFMRNEVAKKKDLLELEERLGMEIRRIDIEIRAEFGGHITRIDGELKDIRAEIKSLKVEMKEIEHRLFLKLAAFGSGLALFIKYLAP